MEATDRGFFENLFWYCHQKVGNDPSGREAGLKPECKRVHQKLVFALLTEERRATGIFGILDIRENTVISNLKNYRSKAFPLMLDDKKMRQDTQWSIDAMHTKTPTQETKIRSLSGGNQQKVIFGKMASYKAGGAASGRAYTRNRRRCEI